MKLVFSSHAWEDYEHWRGLGSDKTLDRIHALIRETRRTPFKGLGKPEPLKGDLTGWWSRRITDEHRFIYRVRGKDDTQTLEIAQLRYHY